MPLHPSGTVTFMFSDVESSTRLWEEHPGLMRDALALHDLIVKEAIDGSAGYVFATGGDSFSAAFGAAQDAAQAAIEAQRRLAEADWGETPIRVRMALHTGEAEERDGDYFGPALNRAARLLAVGHGGQVLVSATTASLLDSGDLVLTDLGVHSLKDLSEPEHVFQLSEDGTRFPALRSLDALPNNLPPQLTSFVGREEQLMTITELITSNRMVTLTGVGGSGKTRLALQAAGEVVEEFADGVWLVELAAVDDPALVPQAVVDGMDLALRGEGSVVEKLESFMEPRELLVILDNCEHLLDSVAEMAYRLLQACPGLSVLATSREGLAIEGERMWRVPSMHVGEDPTAELGEGTRSEAVRLFAERAAQVVPDFEVTDETATDIVQICRRLDGMPLAIELAAVRTRILPVAEISERLNDRFRLLSGGRRTRLERQQTLLATVNWSYELLSTQEQLMFDRLGVFLGGFSLEAAEAVCSGDGIDEFEVLDLITQLVDKSLAVRQTSQSRAPRFRMLETLRQFSLDRLVDSGDIDRMSRRHADHFLAFAEEAEPKLETAEMAVWLDRLETDHDNLRAALEWMQESGDATGALRMTVALSVWFWFIRRHHEEAYRWHKATLSLEVEDQDLLAKAFAKASMQAARVEERDHSVEWAKTALDLASAVNDHRSRVTALWSLSEEKVVRGHRWDESIALLEEAAEIADATGDDVWLSRLGFYLGLRLDAVGRREEARSAAERALEVGRRTGWPMGWAEAAFQVAVHSLRAGDFEAATGLAEEGLQLELEMGDPWNIAYAYSVLGSGLRLSGDLERALDILQEGLDSLPKLAELGHGGALVLELAASLLGAGDVSNAAAQAKDFLADMVGTPWSYFKALGLIRTATILTTVGEWAPATKCLGQADRILETRSPPEPWIQAEQERQIINARDELGPDKFAAIWTEGRSLKVDDVLEEAIGWLDVVMTGAATSG